MLAHGVNARCQEVHDALLILALGRGKGLVQQRDDLFSVGIEFSDHELCSRHLGLARDDRELGESFKAARGVVVEYAYEFRGLVYAVVVDLFVDLAKELVQLGKVGSFHVPVEILRLDHESVL